jgi:hypothetical protein
MKWVLVIGAGLAGLLLGGAGVGVAGAVLAGAGLRLRELATQP